MSGWKKKKLCILLGILGCLDEGMKFCFGKLSKQLGFGFGVYEICGHTLLFSMEWCVLSWTQGIKQECKIATYEYNSLGKCNNTRPKETMSANADEVAPPFFVIRVRWMAVCKKVCIYI